MKLLQRLRSMGPSVEAPADRPGPEASPGLKRDDYLNPPAQKAFEPVLGVPGAGGEPVRGDLARH
jgi:hypothetical protein